jgi:hypothetical protein
MKRLAIGMLFGLVTLLSATPSDAGAVYQAASCYKNADNSGNCYGNFLGFRNNANAQAQAQFYASSYSNPYFYAELNGTWYFCNVVPGSAVMSMWPQVMANRGTFSIAWNSAGECQSINFGNGSSFSNY